MASAAACTSDGAGSSLVVLEVAGAVTGHLVSGDGESVRAERSVRVAGRGGVLVVSDGCRYVGGAAYAAAVQWSRWVLNTKKASP
jgi:hypothetical protein